MNQDTRIQMIVLLGLLTFSLSSCAGRHLFSEREAREAVCVVVENQNFNEVTVYAKRDGTRFRLGSVESMVSREFRIPNRILAGAYRFTLVADPLAASEVAETHELDPLPGCQTRWMLGPNLMASRVVFR